MKIHSGCPEQAVARTRREVIDRLRAELRGLTDGENSLCQVAGERGIFCQGFRRWPASEFDRRWRAAIGRSTHLSRPQMEELANIWQLAEQVRCGVALVCDAPIGPGSACRGWDELSDADLARHCLDILGETVIVISDGESRESG